MHAIHNARIQLLATAVNNLALAVMVAGFVAPAINGQLRSVGGLALMIAWFVFGVGLHFCGQLVLGRLRQ